MSDDFITGLRGDLVEAVERHRRSRARVAARLLLPRLWRPALAAATVAAGAVAVLFAANALSPSPPAVQPEIAAVVQIGGQPEDAVLAEGSLWVSDFAGRVIRVDPAGGRVTARIDVAGNPLAIAAGPDGVWVTSPALSDDNSLLSRIDPRSGRVVARVRVPGYVDAVAAAAGGVWVVDQQHPRLDRIDPASGERTARVPFGRAGTLAAGGDTTLWALGDDGTVIAVDGGSLAVDRLRGAVDGGHGPPGNSLAADSGGAWVVAAGTGEVVHIQAGRVVSRIEVPEAAGPIAVGDTAVWVASGDLDALPGRWRLTRIDTDAAEATATVDLGRRQPKALIAAGDDVWVIAADGTALLVKTRAG